MRSSFFIFLCVFTAYFALQRYQHPQLNFNSVMDRISHPTDTRLRYAIAEVDSRFGLSKDQVIQLAEQATQIWKQGTGRDYFVYDPNAQLKIHLIYDQRQDESNQRRQQLGQLDAKEQAWAVKNQQLEQEKQNLKQQIILLKNREQSLQQQHLNFQNQMIAWTRQGHLSPEQQQSLEQGRQRLRQNTVDLEQENNRYNQKVENYNRLVAELNQMDRHIGQSVDQFNQRFQPRLFDKGQFNGREILVYEFESEDDLKVTLAHEFGHALGLDHHNDPYALMYPQLSKQNLKEFRLGAADLVLLNKR